MLYVFPKTIGILITISTLLTSQMNAYCSRCVKIEEERAEEQSKHPQTVGYYDDQINLHASESRSSPNTNAVPHQKKEAGSLNESSTGIKKSASPLVHPLLNSSKTEESQNNQASLLTTIYLAQQSDSVNQLTHSSFSSPFRHSRSQEMVFEENEATFMNSSPLSPENSNEVIKREVSNSERNPFTFPATYSTLLTILKTKLFLETLDGSFTLFIPTNEALHQLSPSTLRELTKPENQEKLAALVSNHVIAKKILKKDFETNHNREIKAISGRNLTVQSEKGILTIDNARILNMEPAGYDGVIYLIDKVLIP